MTRTTTRSLALAALLASATLVGCDDAPATSPAADDASLAPTFARTLPVTTVYGVDADNFLVRFRTNQPAIVRRVAITGTSARIVGIDFRPNDLNPADGVDNTGKLYGVSRDGKVYTINLASGAATLVATLTVPLDGSSFGVGFNPVVDRLRIHTNNDQNLRVNVDAGTTLVDGPLAYDPADARAGQNPRVTATAYTNSTSPAPTATELFAIDAAADALVKLNAPNNGLLRSVGPLGTPTFSEIGFDIPGTGVRKGIATLSLSRSPNPFLYEVDLDSGRAQVTGRVGITRPLISIAIAP
jgi:hypothetical protein